MHGNFSPASGTGFTAGVAQFTFFARPQAVNGRLRGGTISLHSVSVVVVVSERQGGNHFSLNQKPTVQPERAR